MIRVALRQLRTQALCALGAFAILAIVLGITGPHIVHLYATSGIADCGEHGDCEQLTENFLTGASRLVPFFNALVLVVPALIGIFLGAPLIARELESGTFRLAFSQSISRTRWVVVKIVVVGLAAMVIAALFSLAVTWWSSPMDRVNDVPFSIFDRRDLTPIGYSAFCFALGAALGSFTRRTLPAMAATLVGYIVFRFVVFEWVRSRLITPLRLVAPLQAPTGPSPVANGAGALNSADWIVSDETINAAGKVIGQNGGIGPNGNFEMNVNPDGKMSIRGVGVCRGVHAPVLSKPRAGLRLANPQGINSIAQRCVNELHLKEVLTYQPVSRYWPLQCYETAIFVALAIVLGALSIWKVTRRLA